MPSNAFEYFIGRKQRAVVDLLEQNPDVNAFMAALLDHLVQYANEEGIPLRAVQLDRPYVTNTGEIRAQIRRDPRF